MRRWPLSHRIRVADSLCSSGRWSGSGRGPLVVSFGRFPFSLAAGSFETAAARQPASECAATECWVYLSTDTEWSQR